MDWERPSERVCDLIRQGAMLAVNARQILFDELDKAALASEYVQGIAGDPVLVEALRRSNRSNQLHWAAANISHPGEPVPASLGEDTMAVVRDGIRRGLEDAAIVDVYRLAQNVAWRSWMRLAFELTSDPAEMRELLEVSERSITSFLSTTISALYHEIRAERDELSRGTHAKRLETVALILDGAALPRRHAEKQLGYLLGQCHTAAVVWGDGPSVNLAEVDRAADALLETVAGRRSLSVLASSASRWVWLPGADGSDLTGIETALDDLPGVRIAVGPTAAGIEGFRRSHLDAITTQRTMMRLGSPQRIARFTDVELIALITADPEQAGRFIRHTLGGFESADAELQRTVLAFLHRQCNASRTAAHLFIHRNTLLRRLARADELLPQPLADTSVNVAVALEALRWRNAGVGRL